MNNSHLRDLEVWAKGYGLKPDDPLYGAYLAAKAAGQGAEASIQALADVQAAIAQIPAAAEQGPRIVEGLAELRERVDALKSRSERLLNEFERHGEHHMRMPDLTTRRVFLTEKGERQERIKAIAKEVREAAERPPRSSFVVAVVLLLACLFAGGWLERENLRLHHQIAPAPITYLPSGKLECIPVQGGQKACFIEGHHH
jgi:hypothetical protein